MATVVRSGTGLQSTTNTTSYTTGLIATTADALIIGIVYTTGQIQATPTFASGSFTFSLIRRDGATNSIYVFASDTLDDGVSKAFTITFSANSTGCAIEILSVTSMTRTGSSSIKQSATNTVAAAGTPTASFGASASTSNPCVAILGNATNPAGTGWTPTSWTNRSSTGYNTPTTGLGVASIDSGFTSSTVTGGGTSASAGQFTIIELDTSAPAAAVFPPVVMRSGGIIGA